MTDPWMTAVEAAEHARVSVRTIWEHAETGRLSGCKPGGPSGKGKWLFRRSDVDAWIEAGRTPVVRGRRTA